MMVDSWDTRIAALPLSVAVKNCAIILYQRFCLIGRNVCSISKSGVIWISLTKLWKLLTYFSLVNQTKTIAAIYIKTKVFVISFTKYNKGSFIYWILLNFVEIIDITVLSKWSNVFFWIQVVFMHLGKVRYMAFKIVSHFIIDTDFSVLH